MSVCQPPPPSINKIFVLIFYTSQYAVRDIIGERPLLWNVVGGYSDSIYVCCRVGVVTRQLDTLRNSNIRIYILKARYQSTSHSLLIEKTKAAEKRLFSLVPPSLMMEIYSNVDVIIYD